MSLFLGQHKRSWIPERPVPVFRGASPYGSAVNIASDPDMAMTASAVWACVSMLAGSISMLSLDALRETNGVPRRVDSALIRQPSADLTQSEWLHMLMVSLLLRGNAFGKIVARDRMQYPTQIELLNPDLMRVKADAETGQVTYLYGPKQTDITGDVWHVRGLTMPGAKVGLSPISYAAAVIGLDLSTRKFANDFFTGGGIPKAVLTSDQFIDQTKADTLKARLLAATRNREPLVLGLGATYQTISVSPEESQFLLTQQANVGDIARYFGIRPEKIGGSSGGNLAYSSPEMNNLDYLTFTVAPWLKRIEDALFPLLPSPEFAHFNTSALLRTDAKTQAEVDNMQLAGKTRAPSELRQRDGLPPMTEQQKAEVDLVPLTVTPNGGAKALPALKQPPGPEAPVPTAEQQPAA